MTRGFPYRSAPCKASRSADALKEFLRTGSVLALTGAGISTDSDWFSKFRRESRWRNSDGETEPENAPDGDTELSAGEAAEFYVPSCTWCGGVLKPDAVFFGDSVPKPKLTNAWEMLDEARSLFVLGSSLTVYSGFMFVD